MSRIARAHQHALELRAGAHELLVLLLGAEAHHPLDAGAVVPGAVEQDDLAGGGQVGDVALEVPLRLLALGRRGKRDDAADARVRPLGDALDHAALAGGVTPLEDHDDLQPVGLDVLLHDHELALEPSQLLVELLARQLAGARLGLRFAAVRGLGFRGHVLLRSAPILGSSCGRRGSPVPCVAGGCVEQAIEVGLVQRFDRCTGRCCRTGRTSWLPRARSGPQSCGSGGRLRLRRRHGWESARCRTDAHPPRLPKWGPCGLRTMQREFRAARSEAAHG